MAASVSFKMHKDGSFFSDEVMKKEKIDKTCSDSFEGNFDAPMNKDVPFNMYIEKLGTKTIYVALEIDTVMHEFTKQFADIKFMPKQIDTFALANSNDRNYRFLKLWDWKMGKGADGQVTWGQIMNIGAHKFKIDQGKLERAKERVRKQTEEEVRNRSPRFTAELKRNKQIWDMLSRNHMCHRRSLLINLLEYAEDS